LKGTPKREILFKRNKNDRLEAYIGAYYEGSVVDRGQVPDIPPS